MRIHYDAGVTGLTGIGYTIYNADGTVAVARATTGVTEEPAGSGSYGVTVADATLAGRTVVWDRGVGTIGASECFPVGLAIVPAVAGDAMTLTAAYDKAKDDVLTPLAVVDGNVDAILEDTGTTLPATLALTGEASTAVATLNDFDPATDVVAHVTLVDTTTTNTDMRGTDGAATASALAIVSGKVDAVDDLVDTEVAAIKTVVDAIAVHAARIYRYFFNKRTHTNAAVTVYADNGTDIDATMVVSGDTTTVTKNAPS